MSIELFEIESRFCGPPRSGNGGYVCGRIAKHLSGPVAVRLKVAPPLGTPLRLESTDAQAQLFHDAILVGEAKRAPLELDTPKSPPFAEAESATRSFLGFTQHAFPRCFVCGPERQPTDGLRIFPGRVGSSTVLAAPWQPDASLGDKSGKVGSEFIWAALDCTGGFAVLPLPEGAAIVLGELCASVVGDVVPGERYVVAGWPLGSEGRKRFAGSAVFAENGSLVAKARAVWIEVPATAWN